MTACLIYLRIDKISKTKEVPVVGGTYSEGILESSTETLNEITTYLTSAGLTRLGSDGSIKPSLAKSWQVSENGQDYTFTLQKGINSYDLIGLMHEQKGSWSEVDISAPNPKTLSIHLKQPFGQFLASTLEPTFSNGPYQIEQKTSHEVSFVPNLKSPIHPYFARVIIKIYSTPQELYAALKTNQVIASAEALPRYPHTYKKYSFNLPRYQMAFLNTGKAPFSDKATRQQLLTGAKFSKPLKITMLLPDTPKASNFANSLISRWKSQNIIVKTQKYDLATLLSIEAPKKNYDVIIYGINLGYYNDLYPCWHSSQIIPAGLNFSQTGILSLDKLLQEARLTLDDKVRKEKYLEAQKIITDEYVVVNEESTPSNFYVHKGIKGINITSATSPLDRFTFIDKWYINTTRIPNK